MTLLSDAEITDGLAGGPWARDGDAIVLERTMADFAAAIAFVDAVAAAAEAADHHPDILVHGWNRVRLTLSTHSAGGITGADLQLARTIAAIP